MQYLLTESEHKELKTEADNFYSLLKMLNNVTEASNDVSTKYGYIFKLIHQLQVGTPAMQQHILSSKINDFR